MGIEPNNEGQVEEVYPFVRHVGMSGEEVEQSTEM